MKMKASINEEVTKVINKKLNVMIQVTFPKEDAENLKTLQKAFHNEGVKVTKSEILVKALREYLTFLVGFSKLNEQKKVGEPKEEKVNA